MDPHLGWEAQGSFLLQTRGGGMGWWLLELGQHLTPLQHPYLRVWDGSLVRERVGDVPEFQHRPPSHREWQGRDVATSLSPPTCWRRSWSLPWGSKAVGQPESTKNNRPRNPDLPPDTSRCSCPATGLLQPKRGVYKK